MSELYIILGTAMLLGFSHTILGPDHYIPFIVLSKARNWKLSKTMWITFFSGVGHIVGSVVLGIIGVTLGISVAKLESVEAIRGDIAAWMLMIFGTFYTVYGINKVLKKGMHSHLPKFLFPKSIRNYRHFTDEEIKKDIVNENKLTPWVLFLIFVFGPCEVLIPMLIYPAAKHDMIGVFSVAGLFGLTTIATMMSAVFIGYKGVSFVVFKEAHKYFHVIAGLIVLFMGVGILFLGF